MANRLQAVPDESFWLCKPEDETATVGAGIRSVQLEIAKSLTLILCEVPGGFQAGFSRFGIVIRANRILGRMSVASRDRVRSIRKGHKITGSSATGDLTPKLHDHASRFEVSS